MSNKTKVEQAIEQLKALQGAGDTEAQHGTADLILCDLLNSLGYEEVVQEYIQIDKWYA